jgi:hypothetical protein
MMAKLRPKYMLGVVKFYLCVHLLVEKLNINIKMHGEHNAKYVVYIWNTYLEGFGMETLQRNKINLTYICDFKCL